MTPAPIKFDPVETLRDILGEDPSPRTKRSVAKLLNEVGRPAKPWGVGYIENIAAGRQDPGSPILRAIRAIWIHKSGGPPLNGAFESAVLKIRPGQVESGALVLGKSRRCPYCGTPFVPAVGNQKFDNPYCGYKFRKEKRK